MGGLGSLGLSGLGGGGLATEQGGPSTPLSGQLSYLVAVPTSLGAATAQAALRPAAVEVRKYWTGLEDEEILRRHTPHAKRHTPHATRHAPRARAPAP